MFLRDTATHPFPTFNGCLAKIFIEVKTCGNIYIPLVFKIDVIIYPPNEFNAGALVQERNIHLKVSGVAIQH